MSIYLKLFFVIFLFFSHSSVFAQKVFHKGYIIQTNQDTIKGFILTNKSENYHNEVIFKPSKKAEEKKYQPNQLLSFCIEKNNVYKSFNFQLMDEHSLLIDQKAQKFLKAIVLGDHAFYKYELDNVDMFYSYSDESGLVPLNVELEKVEFSLTKTGDIRLTSGQRIFDPFKGAYYYSENGKFKYFYDGNQVYLVKKKYLEYLSVLESDYNCTKRKINNEFENSETSIKKYGYNLRSCEGGTDKVELIKKKSKLQLSLLGGVKHNSFNSEFGLEKGFEIELRNNNISPNVSILYGRSWFKGEAILFSEGNVDNNYYDPSTNYARLNYHLFAGKTIRPFIGSGVKIFNYTYDVIASDMTIRTENATRMKIGGTLGVDFYFLEFNQLRIEASIIEQLELGISYGICLK